MRFGLFGGALAADGISSDSQSYEQFVNYVLEADELGFHSVFVVEHHFTGIGQVSATLGLLSYLAARTKRIRLGTGVIVMPWHNPVLLAEQIATLDLLSGGRADIGIGKGYRPNEFHGFNVPMSEAAARYEENLQVLVQALSSRERFSHSGKYWTFNDIIVEPTPVQQPHPPIWVGATSVGSIEKTAAQGLNLLLDHWTPPEVIAERIVVYQNALVASGREFSPELVGVTRAIQVTESEEARDALIDARAKMLISMTTQGKGGAGPGLAIGGPVDGEMSITHAREIAARPAVIGSPEEVICKLKELERAGVEYVLLADASASLDALRKFAREVMPAFANDKAISDMAAAAA